MRGASVSFSFCWKRLFLVAGLSLGAVGGAWGQTTYYADAARPDDSGNGLSWAAAKQSIQAAVDLAADGDTVLVTNGTYNTGSVVTPGYLLPNRVCITKPIQVQSVNGPDVTTIAGVGPVGNSAIRGVFMTNGCSLAGFTIANGGCITGGDGDMDQSGAGLWAAADCIVSNCLIVANTAAHRAGGIYGGQIYNSVVRGNTVNFSAGGGAFRATLNNCLISENTAVYGGGMAYCTLNNCTVTKNNGEYGGGTHNGTINNCIIWSNIASVHDDNILAGTATVQNTCSPDGVTNGVNGCITGDPKFMDAANSNYSLQARSPCVNAGNNAYAPTNSAPYDLAGNPRVLFGTVDMGAYERVSLISAESGPSAGGNTIVVTNGVALGNGTDITNVTVCGVAATIVDQGTDWVKVTLGAGPSGGTTGDVSIQSTSEGTMTMLQVYTYNPMGLISRVTPSIGSVTGGYQVVINGSHLGSGSDVHAVTLCGVSVQSMVSQSPTQVVVTACAGFRGVGNVVIQSTGYGTITLANGFTYRDPVFLDFDGDGKADIATYYPAAGMWSILQSSLNTGRYQSWGWRDATPVPGDYDGDSLFDVAVYAPQTGTWLIWQSATQTERAQSWGWNETIPVPGDYDGDEKCDLAVYVPASGVWHIWQSATQTARTQSWGWSGAVPVPGDYDGDGMTDVTVYNPESGTWHIWQSATQTARTQAWGWPDAEPIPGDYDGDGKTDVAVYWPDSGMWYAWLSATQTGMTASWGWNAAWPVPADYDGDGIFDRAVYAPELGLWYIWQSATQTPRTQPWGFEQAEPVN